MEFHAVILCGPGHLLAPFSLTRASGIAKPLLPIANRPMLHYVLEWCQSAVFSKITVLCDPQDCDEISASISEFKNNTSILAVSSSPHSGSAVQALSKLVTTPFILLPCDFITNLPPHVLIDAYRNMPEQDAAIAVYYKNQLDIDDKNKKIFPPHYTIYADRQSADPILLDSYSMEDVRFHKSLPLRSRLCWTYPHSTVSTDAQWAGILLALPRLFDAFKQDPVKFSPQYFTHRSAIKVVRDLARQSWQKSHRDVGGNVEYFCVPSQASFFRCNSVPVWMEAQRHFMRIQTERIVRGEKQVDKPLLSGEKNKLLPVIGIDSCVHESTTLGDRTNVKRSTVGPNCVIGKRVRITGCLILHGCTIEDDVQLENCIIGHGATIRLKLKLVGCNVELTHDVPRHTIAKNEELLRLSLEGIVSGDDMVVGLSSDGNSDDDEDDSESYTSLGSDEIYQDEYTANDDGLFAY